MTLSLGDSWKPRDRKAGLLRRYGMVRVQDKGRRQLSLNATRPKKEKHVANYPYPTHPTHPRLAEIAEIRVGLGPSHAVLP